MPQVEDAYHSDQTACRGAHLENPLQGARHLSC